MAPLPVTPHPRLLGQFSTAQAAATRRLAATLYRLAAGKDGAGVVPTRRQGVIVSAQAGPPPSCTVDFGGGAIVAGVRYQDGYTPVPGQVVEVQIRDGDPTIQGALAT